MSFPCLCGTEYGGKVSLHAGMEIYLVCVIFFKEPFYRIIKNIPFEYINYYNISYHYQSIDQIDFFHIHQLMIPTNPLMFSVTIFDIFIVSSLDK